jgi:hypothetical protein
MLKNFKALEKKVKGRVEQILIYGVTCPNLPHRLISLPGISNLGDSLFKEEYCLVPNNERGRGE